MRAHERLLSYVRVDTTSDEFAGKTPSTPGQLELAGQLADEMRSLSFEGVRVTDDGFVYGFLPATKGLEHLPCLGLIAHMDTAPDFAGKDVRPQVHERYDGGDVRLAGSGDVLSPAQFPTLARLAGKTLITTDGTTLLGADDKAGIAEILTACEQIVQSGAPHCRLAVAFTTSSKVSRYSSNRRRSRISSGENFQFFSGVSMRSRNRSRCFSFDTFSSIFTMR